MVDYVVNNPRRRAALQCDPHTGGRRKIREQCVEVKRYIVAGVNNQ